jgi:hypothetical protein
MVLGWAWCQSGNQGIHWPRADHGSMGPASPMDGARGDGYEDCKSAVEERLGWLEHVCWRCFLTSMLFITCNRRSVWALMEAGPLGRLVR